MLPSLTQAKLESVPSPLPPLEAATPAAVSSPTASLIGVSLNNYADLDWSMLLLPSPPSCPPFRRHDSSFDSVKPAFLSSFQPQPHYPAHALIQEQGQPQSRSHSQQIHHHNLQTYGSTFDSISPAAPELYESFLRSRIDAHAQRQQQRLRHAASNVRSFTLSMSDEVDLSNVAGSTIIVGANEQLQWTSSTPSFPMPSFDSSGAGTPVKRQSHDVFTQSPFSFSQSDSNAGSIGAIRGSHARAGWHAHPYDGIGRLEASARKAR